MHCKLISILAFLALLAAGLPNESPSNTIVVGARSHVAGRSLVAREDGTDIITIIKKKLEEAKRMQKAVHRAAGTD